MPETAVYEHYLSSAGEDHVWATRKRAGMQPISVAHSMYKTSDTKLDLRILIPDPTHSLASFRTGKGIHINLVLTTDQYTT